MAKIKSDLSKLITKHKSALTRAKKKGPKAVIAACDAAEADWDKLEYGWPDNWHIWNVARGDAETELRFPQER